ncbi:MAG: hypothetical protein RLZZ15_4097 [Verrucomicrobiota bacterium]|jgi:hypothetical protein
MKHRHLFRVAFAFAAATTAVLAVILAVAV